MACFFNIPFNFFFFFKLIIVMLVSLSILVVNFLLLVFTVRSPRDFLLINSSLIYWVKWFFGNHWKLKEVLNRPMQIDARKVKSSRRKDFQQSQLRTFHFLRRKKFFRGRRRRGSLVSLVMFLGMASTRVLSPTLVVIRFIIPL